MFKCTLRLKKTVAVAKWLFQKKPHQKRLFLPFKIFKNSNTKNTPFSKIGESGSKNDFFYLFTK